MMTAYRFGIVVERSELRLADRGWRGGRYRLEFARGLHQGLGHKRVGDRVEISVTFDENYRGGPVHRMPSEIVQHLSSEPTGGVGQASTEPKEGNSSLLGCV